jgi:succinylglutamate desuccinylase
MSTLSREELAELRARRRTNSTSPLRRVAIVGATHGNETTSVYLAQHFLAHPRIVRRASFETQVLLANPGSVAANARFVDVDLNRCFLLNDLQRTDRDLSLEQGRAREIDALLGPKGSDSPRTDFVFDLHNTTANTGVALMLAPDDTFAHEGSINHDCPFGIVTLS